MRDTTRPLPPGACPSSGGEFGLSHCAEIAGRVVELRSQPLAGTYVWAAAQEDVGLIGGPSPTTGADGSFRLTQYLAIGPEDAPAPVGLTLLLVAHGEPRRYPPGPDGRAIRSDSVSVVVEFAPAGEVPDTVEVELTLPVP